MTRALGHERNPTLDAFRGIAILSVIAYHYTADAEWAGLTTIKPSFAVGRFGVQLFFVISGLVISMTARASANPVEFGVKRLARLYPAYLFWMLVTWTSLTLVQSTMFAHSPIDLVKNIFPLPGRHPNVDPSYWSLVPELQFYGFTALSLFVSRRYYWIGLAIVTLLGTAIGAMGYPEIADDVLVARYMPLFLTGMAAWLVIYEKKREGWICGLVAMAALPAAALRWDTYFHPHWEMVAYVGGLVAVMLGLLARHIKVGLGPLSWIGLRSYSLYLLHQALGMTAAGKLHVLGLPDWLCLAVVFGVAILLAHLSFRYIEEPSSRVIRRAFKRVSQRKGARDAGPSSADKPALVT